MRCSTFLFFGVAALSSILASNVQGLTLTSADSVCGDDHVVVTFSDPVDPTTATDAGNYSIDQGATINSVAMGNQPNEVLVFAGPISQGTVYTLAVNSVTTDEPDPVTIADDASIEFQCEEAGSDPDCAVEVVSLNTGLNHATGGLYAVGDPDPFWTVVDDPDSGTTEPRPTAVISPNSAWEAALPDSGWISAYPTASNNLNGEYDLETTFCVLPEAGEIELDLCLRADDWAEVYLNGVLIGATPNPSFNTANPTCINVTDQTLFVTGQNTLTVRMINAFGVAMGVNLAGQVRGDGLVLEDPLCCQPDGSLSGQKFNDQNNNGVWDPGEPAMSGWTIELSNGDTAVTDSNGYYYFTNLPADSYTITETQQSGWAQTAPGSGGHNVTLSASQSISGLDFGNFRDDDVQNDPPKVECSESISVPCEGPNGTDATVSAQISDPDGDALTYVWEVNGSPVQNGSIPAGGPPTTGTATLTHTFSTGTNNVTLIVTDSEGNEAACEITVEVEAEPWELRCPEEILIEDCPAVVPDMTDSIGIINQCAPLSDYTVTQDPPAGTPLNEGDTPVFITVTGPDGEQQECAVIVTVDCFSCEVDTVSLNTGFDHTTGGLYSVGDPDPFWTVVDDPDSGTTEPRPAAVISPNSAWEPALPDSGWISAYPTASNNLNGDYDLQTTFCVLPEAGEIELDLCLRADDWAEVYLNGTLIATTPNPSFNTSSPTCVVVNNPAMFVTGQNTLTVRMINAFGVAMGVNMTGQVRGDGLVLEDPRCCQSEGSLSGQKFNDLNNNGVWDTGEPAMSGWTIELSNGDTAVTDSNGYYYFTNLPAGSYTVTEVQQGGWVQTAPASGSHNVTLTASQSISGLDFGNYREGTSDTPPTIECSKDIRIPCEDPNGTPATVSAQMSDADGDPLTYVWEVNGTPVQNGSINAGGPPTTGSSTLTYAFPTGANVVTITVTDSAGNEASCETTVTVTDSEPPVIRCRDGVITIPAGDDCFGVLPDVPVVVKDNCTPEDDLVITQDPPAGTALPPGTHTVVVTVTDSAGNEARCKVEVRVADKTPPEVRCPEPREVEACEATIPDFIDEAFISDNCDEVSDLTVTQSPAPGTVVGPGTHTVTITVEDSSGNVATCSTSYTVVAPPLSVEPIELFNTGVDGNSTVLADSSVDPHYELTVSADPNFPGPDAMVVNSTGFPMGSWIVNDTTSKWIAPRADAGNANASGEYVYETTFTLPAGMTGAAISGRWLSDNDAEIRLNGVPTGDTKPINGFSMWTNFSITSGFVPGVNTLEFVVTARASSTGVDYPTGLRVEMEGRVEHCEVECLGAHVLQNPVSLTRPQGSTATFSVSAGGTPPLTYQWYHNNNLIPGATSPSLTVAPVNFSDAGAYHVLVTNECGEAVSERAVLRVRRRLPWVVGQWDFEPGDPLGATIGPDMEYLDSADGAYGSTASSTHFGSSRDFGIPGIEGRPVNVMRISPTDSRRGYVVRGDAPENEHTFVFDLFFPEESAGVERPLLQADYENDGYADLYVRAGIGGGDCDDDDICVPPGKWARVAIVVKEIDATTPKLVWYIDGDKAGERPLAAAELDDWLDLDSDGDGLDDGSERMLLFTDGFGADGIGYVSSIQWHNTVLSDLEIASLGKASAEGVPSSNPYLLKPEVVLERNEANQDEFILYWVGEGFRLQESDDLQTWTDSDLSPHVEIIEDEVVHEVTIPVPADAKRFYRVVED